MEHLELILQAVGALMVVIVAVVKLTPSKKDDEKVLPIIEKLQSFKDKVVEFIKKK